MTTPLKVRDWVVSTPFRTRWRPKFSSESAAWRRVITYFKKAGETDEACRDRLQDIGWRVTHEPMADDPKATFQKDETNVLPP